MTVSIPSIDPTRRTRTFAFDQFQFPACTNCNSNHRVLEDSAKPVIEKLLSGTAPSALEVNSLLDWFDKVRIGLWLGYRYLDRNLIPVEPKFYIAGRIGLRDRALVIVRAGDDRRGLSFAGIDTPAFRFFPSCFALMINDLAFLNMSSEMLCARRLGFPFIKEKPVALHGGAEARVLPGRLRAVYPVVRLPFERHGLSIYQACFREFQAQAPDFYDERYILNNSLSDTASVPFVEQHHDRVTSWNELTESSLLVPSLRTTSYELWTRLVKDALKLQAALLEYEYSDRNLPKAERLRWREKVAKLKSFNQWAIGSSDAAGNS